jgi:hypothetical protein
VAPPEALSPTHCLRCLLLEPVTRVCHPLVWRGCKQTILSEMCWARLTIAPLTLHMALMEVAVGTDRMNIFGDEIPTVFGNISNRSTDPQ